MASPSAGERPATVLAWLVGALGDTLLGYPALRALREWAPQARMVVAGRPAYLEFALGQGVIDAVIDPDSRTGAALASGRTEPGIEVPELAVIWSSAARQIADGLLAAGAPAVVASPAHAADPRHQSRYLLDCLRPLGLPKVLRTGPPPALAVAPQSKDLWPDGGDRVVLLHPGAGSRWKCWPIASYRRLAVTLRGYGLHVRWSFGPADQALRAQISQDPVCADEVWPEMPLRDFAALLRQCALLVSADCGVAHLAALLATPQLALFGPTDPRRWRPISRKARMITAQSLCDGTWEVVEEQQTTGLSLRRCAPRAARGCRCLEALPVEVVSAECLSLALNVLPEASLLPSQLFPKGRLDSLL